MTKQNNTYGCGGCISTILFFLLMGALLFGVNYHGKLYKITCNSKDGVGLKAKEDN